MIFDSEQASRLADRLVKLYEVPFGGKTSGRYRIAAKTLRQAAGRRRFYEEDIRLLQRVLFEKGYVLIDMDAFFVMLSANAFVNTRRANEDCFD